MILIILKILVAYFLPWLIGYLALELIDRDKKFCFGYKFFASFLLGNGFFTLQTFALAVWGFSLSLSLFFGIIIVDLILLEALLWFFQKRLAIPRFKVNKNLFIDLSTPQKFLLALFLILIMLKAGFSFWQVAHSPIYEFDAWNNWSLRAKVIYTEQKIPLEAGKPFYLGGGIKSYPLNDGIWKVWLAEVLGEWNDQLVNVSSVFIYLILTGIFYFSLPKILNFSSKIIATYLLASLPFLYFHSWIPYADLEFTAYLFLAVSTLMSFLKRENPDRDESLPRLYLSAIALALAIWTKNEGFAVVLPVILGLSLVFAFSKLWQLKYWLYYWLTVAIVASPWLIFRFVNHLDILSGDSSTFQLVSNSRFLVDWFSSVFLRGHFNFLWLFLLLLLIFKAKLIWQDLSLRNLSLVLISLFLLYNGIILFTDKAYDLSAMNRVNLQISPLALLLTVLILRRIIPSLNKDDYE
ncbi:MAG: hypothetical protein A2731_01175 [Candidatus Buchananbacteria bacterium RIFCSPHIGHO2_01_FULL_39_8]|uniref:Glycosyltransferase RgtA/B/C/D-like domain-containing protein n=1 Tax=Candidatus Buchananbacteria bacterium RIFCSPHIGHO2_01_FULL_39_8 TaxID=1797533 RepID=A0A1G1Y3N2_9BACT|nr:MAG: hypothetical protein A2731_01175 [Candidatus Buchananbacteria bacterium RIFCSPHIGHO2_01_FULL_39_8]